MPSPAALPDLEGLTSEAAAARLREEGPNELPSERQRSLARVVIEVMREPMFLLLAGAGALYLLLGDLADALTLLAFVLVIIGITVVQERKTERALDALRSLSSPRALVVRDGRALRIPGRQVVRGDAVVLAEGDRVPADGVLVDAVHLEVDESLLTGESLPVRKRSGPGAGPGTSDGGEAGSVFAGTLVVRGHAVVRITATGERTRMGRIGAALREIEPERTPLEREVGLIVRRIAVLGALLCGALVLVLGLARGDWLHGLLAGIALAMAVLPEEFPVVLTVFLALGAFRIARSRVLTRRVPTIETLGAASVLCVDKTGTLTENRMEVAVLEPAGGAPLDLRPGVPELPEEVHALVEFAILASQRDPFDPMEIAFRRLGERRLAGTEHLHADWELIREYPLSAELLAISHVWRAPDGAELVVAAKGAPEAIVDLCHLPAAARDAVADRVRSLASEGLRVLAVAQATFAPGALPPGQHDYDFVLVGLVALADPVRAEVPAAIAECRRAGIRVLMITGDAPETALAIARECGLDGAEGVLAGAEIDALSDAALRERVRSCAIFARALPEQKLRLVRALMANGEVVAMTGDGVNDAPALKAAHIGIAMGGRGTDVAREAAALVLTDDDFSSIVASVRLGRGIFANLRQAMAFVLAVHVPLVGMALLPALLGWPLVLTPVHLAFLQLVIDPACSVAFEAEPADPALMRRPPRAVGDPLLARRVVAVSLLQGLSVLVVAFAAFALSLPEGGEGLARALAFSAVIAGNLGLILVNRSWAAPLSAILRTRNPAAWGVIAGAAALLLLSLYAPPVARLFRFAPPAPLQLLAAGGAGLASLAWFELLKWRWRAAAGAGALPA